MYRFPSSTGRRRAALVLGCALASTLPGAQAATWTVTTAEDDDGALCDVARCSLRAAIARAENADTIDFSPALAYPLTIHLTQPLVVAGKELSIRHPSRARSRSMRVPHRAAWRARACCASSTAAAC
ncbi:MAG: CSLREA domain-containing protein [Dokdonella sp.]|nr:CSLREA domain-containing protein [Dokdonella sp.]